MEENRLQDKLMEILELNRETIEKTAFVKLLEKMVEKYEGERDRVSRDLCIGFKLSNVDLNKVKEEWEGNGIITVKDWNNISIIKENDMRVENVMDFTTYQELSKRTMPDGRYKESISNYAMGLAGEAGEVVDYLKKVVHHGHKFDYDKLTYELGDVLHYVAGLATMYGIGLEEVATLNIAKLGERYPKGFSREDSVKRVDVKKVFKEEELQQQYEHLNAVGEIGEMLNGDK